MSSDTLIPRPDTERLVECVLNIFPDKNKPVKVADLGTGSGAIALALASEQPNWIVHASDISEGALKIASNNAHELGLSNVSFYLGSWCTALPCTDYDVIVSNPPYIGEDEWELYADGLAFEPKHALVSGKDGLLAIREICANALNQLHVGGHLVIEHGFLQGKSVREIFTACGYREIHSLCDLSDQERVTVGRK